MVGARFQRSRGARPQKLFRCHRQKIFPNYFFVLFFPSDVLCNDIVYTTAQGCRSLMQSQASQSLLDQDVSHDELSHLVCRFLVANIPHINAAVSLHIHSCSPAMPYCYRTVSRMPLPCLTSYSERSGNLRLRYLPISPHLKVTSDEDTNWSSSAGIPLLVFIFTSG